MGPTWDGAPCEHDDAMRLVRAQRLGPAFLGVSTLGRTNDTSGDATVPCNPVVGAECTGDGSACDNGLDGFDCYIKPNTVGLCGRCDDEDLSCANGLTCDLRGSRLCARWCCTDADCGDVVGACEVSFTRRAGVGICLTPGPCEHDVEMSPRSPVLGAILSVASPDCAAADIFRGTNHERRCDDQVAPSCGRIARQWARPATTAPKPPHSSFVRSPRLQLGIHGPQWPSVQPVPPG